MTVEPPVAEQQRAVVELYVHSTWIKANLTLEDENLFLEYGYEKHDQSIASEQSFSHGLTAASSNGSTIHHDIPDTITSQKRTVKLIKPDNAGLGKNKFSSCLFFYI